MTVAALNAQAMVAGEGFGRYATRATALDPQVQAHALEATAHRSVMRRSRSPPSLLTGALRSEPTYRLPVPTLLIHGDRDPIGDIATGTRAWAKREPLAEYA